MKIKQQIKACPALTSSFSRVYFRIDIAGSPIGADIKQSWAPLSRDHSLVERSRDGVNPDFTRPKVQSRLFCKFTASFFLYLN